MSTFGHMYFKFVKKKKKKTIKGKNEILSLPSYPFPPYLEEKCKGSINSSSYFLLFTILSNHPMLLKLAYVIRIVRIFLNYTLTIQ